MSDHEITVAANLVYETASAGDGSKHGGVPKRMNWGQLKGQGPRFKVAMEKLERLCYALYGARPLDYSPFTDWYMRPHPRCMWNVEQWKQCWCNMGGGANCTKYNYDFYEYGAAGENYLGGDEATPSVPIRSRSGDPKLQRLDDTLRTFDRAHFPIDSVTRSGDQLDHQGHGTFDPKGEGYFDGDPTKIGTQHGGSTHIYGDPVTITWAPPADYLGTVESATLWYDYGFGFRSVAMQRVGDDYVKEILSPDGYTHGSTIYWYIQASFLPTSGEAYTRYDPGATASPPQAKAYSFVCFTHWNPYPHGLPELWSRCAKGTDRYEFTDDETIQPGLINLARFVLDYISQRHQFNPKTRGSTAECCMDMMIKFRWSGSAPWPHLVGGGKDESDFTAPLHNRSEPAGSEFARRSWRGADHWYGESKAGYGRGASWLSLSSELLVEHCADIDDSSCDVYFTGADRGLRDGDVIERAHIEEIIDAVDFLIDNGLWISQQIFAKALTPTWEIWNGFKLGESRGWGGMYNPYPDWVPYDTDAYSANRACCDTITGDDDDPASCDPYSEPIDWDDCKSGANSFCNIRIGTARAQTWAKNEHVRDGSSQLVWGTTVGSYGQGGETYWSTWGHDRGLPWTNGDPPVRPPGEYCDKYRSSNAYGWAAYICGPEQCPGGCDSSHGNTWYKRRWDNTCPEPSVADSGPSQGNCFDEAYTCGKVWDVGESDWATDPHNLGFETVNQVYMESTTLDWLTWTFTDGEEDDEGEAEERAWDLDECPHFYGSLQDHIPALPGMEDYREYNGDDQCTIVLNTVGHDGDDDNYGEYWACEHSPAVCFPTDVWVKVGLNLDSDNMPNLTAYDPSPGEEFEDEHGNLWTDCPCETATSEWGAGGQWTGNGTCV